MNLEFLSKYRPQALAILRIATALAFIAHGTQKLFGFPAFDFGPVELTSLFGIAAILEIVGGTAILLGIFVRPVAFLLSGMMAYAFWFVHAAGGQIIPAANGGDGAMLFCFIFLYLVFAGPGAWSLESVLKGQRTTAAA